ncbi:protein phosphatase 1 regulatory subunit 36 isoform X1 [Sebastes umbrosus]|uniref:protein phosphatase 1 regulatory subunit 36 isoform X1 n=1 Tax=Sebastes umbrosus TaxID=72105 RepID=UPI0018A0C106|nr:protein phosphatase 1 regulatory subunit 36 isoform X1 [Sebastes umbrosus]
MPKYPEELRNVSVPPPGRWVWREETRTLELISSGPTEEGVLRKRRQINVNFSDLQQRSEWLAEISTSNHRGRQSIRKSLSPAHLHAYRSFVLKNQGGRITTDDVKQVAVSLLQENYSLPIPFCFLAVLKSKELDEVLAALLLYLSFFFEHNSLEKSSKSFMTVDLFTEHKMKAETLAKKEIVQKKLAVRYFNLIMDLDTPSYHKGWMSSNSTRWLLHACLYSFFCFVAWVTFGRKDLRDIQEEVGRLLYSDTFNTAMRNRTERDSGMAFASVNGSVKTGEADPKETGCSGAFKHRTSQRRPALSSIVNQRSPLMVCLLPSPKERSPHLFLGSRAGRQSPPLAKHCDTKALAEELNQQLANVSVGILGKSYRHFIRSTLIPYREQINNRDEDDDLEPESDGNNDSEDPPGVHVQQGSRSSFTGPKSRGLARYGSTTHANTGNSAATVEEVTSDN